MAQHLAPGARADAAMFNAMLHLFFDFGVTLPAEWSTFFRALIVLEGTLTTIAPDYSVIDAAEAIAGQWVRSQISTRLRAAGGPRRDHAHGPDAPAPAAPRRPRVQRCSSATASACASATSRTTDDTRFVTTLVNRVVLAFLAGTIGLLSVGLIAIEGGPPFTGNTSLFQVFGYFGLFCSTVLAMRVIVAVLRDRLN